MDQWVKGFINKQKAYVDIKSRFKLAVIKGDAYVLNDLAKNYPLATTFNTLDEEFEKIYNKKLISLWFKSPLENSVEHHIRIKHSLERYIEHNENYTIMNLLTLTIDKVGEEKGLEMFNTILTAVLSKTSNLESKEQVIDKLINMTGNNIDYTLLEYICRYPKQEYLYLASILFANGAKIRFRNNDDNYSVKNSRAFKTLEGQYSNPPYSENQVAKNLVVQQLRKMLQEEWEYVQILNDQKEQCLPHYAGFGDGITYTIEHGAVQCGYNPKEVSDEQLKAATKVTKEQIIEKLAENVKFAKEMIIHKRGIRNEQLRANTYRAEFTEELEMKNETLYESIK